VKVNNLMDCYCC